MDIINSPQTLRLTPRLQMSKRWPMVKKQNLDSPRRYRVTSHLENGIAQEVLVRIDGDPGGQVDRTGRWAGDLCLCCVLRDKAFQRHGDGKPL